MSLTQVTAYSIPRIQDSTFHAMTHLLLIGQSPKNVRDSSCPYHWLRFKIKLPMCLLTGLIGTVKGLYIRDTNFWICLKDRLKPFIGSINIYWVPSLCQSRSLLSLNFYPNGGEGQGRTEQIPTVNLITVYSTVSQFSYLIPKGPHLWLSNFSPRCSLFYPQMKSDLETHKT